MNTFTPIPKFSLHDSLKPYMSIIERIAFKSTDQKELYNYFLQEFRKKNYGKKAPDSFIAHVPFTIEEHNLVIEYLSIMKYMNPKVSQSNFPIQLENKLKPWRTREDILNYISDILYRGKASYENDVELSVNRPEEVTLEVKKKVVTKDWKTLYKMIECTKDIKSLYRIKHIYGATFIVFTTDNPPLIVNMDRVTNSDNDYSKSISTLLTPILSFTNSGDSCVAAKSWAAIYNQNSFYLFNFARPGRIKGIKTYFSISIPTYIDLSECKYELIPSKKCRETFFLRIENGSSYIIHLAKEESRVFDTKRIVESDIKEAKFTSKGYLFLLTADNEIIEINEKDDINYMPQKEKVSFSEYENIQCDGDAFIFHGNGEIIIFPLIKETEYEKYVLNFEKPCSIITSAYSYGSIAFFADNSLYFCRCSKTTKIVEKELNDMEFSNISIYPITYHVRYGEYDEIDQIYPAFAVVTNELQIYNCSGDLLFKKYNFTHDRSTSNLYTYVHPDGRFFVFANDDGYNYVELNDPIFV